MDDKLETRVESSNRRTQARAHSEPPRGPQPPSSPWFADLKSKLTTFNMTEWLTSLGIGKNARGLQPVLSDTGYSYNSEAVGPPTPTHGRSRSNSPLPQFLTPTAKDVQSDVLTSPDVFELPNFWLNLEPGKNYKDTLELQHFGPLYDLRTLGKQQLGKGHEFITIQLSNPTWCDKCGDFIWGFYKQAVMCSNCKYSCHYKCRMLVTLDCNYSNFSIKTTSNASTFKTARSTLPNLYPENYNDTNIKIEDKFEDFWDEQMTDTTSVTSELAPDLVSDVDFPSDIRILQTQIDEFNVHAQNNMKMSLEDTMRFTGYLPVSLNFTRPINVVSGQRPASIYDVIPNEHSYRDDANKTIQSFYLPRNIVKTLHVSSETSARELIVVLLRKFRVADNPRKFALYERDFETGNTLVAKLRRVCEDACPLRLALSWGNQTSKRFVLQENDTGDILWDAFEIPELNNFLRILDVEEQQYILQIKQKYNLYKEYMQLEIRERKPNLPRSSGTVTLASAPPLSPSINHFDEQISTNPFDNHVHEVKMDLPENGSVFGEDSLRNIGVHNTFKHSKNHKSDNSEPSVNYGTL